MGTTARVPSCGCLNEDDLGHVPRLTRSTVFSELPKVCFFVLCLNLQDELHGQFCVLAQKKYKLGNGTIRAVFTGIKKNPMTLEGIKTCLQGLNSALPPNQGLLIKTTRLDNMS